MESSVKDESIMEVVSLVRLAEKNKVNEDYDQAITYYSNAAELLISLRKSLDKDSPKKDEYKKLAAEILSKAEATK